VAPGAKGEGGTAVATPPIQGTGSNEKVKRLFRSRNVDGPVSAQDLESVRKVLETKGITDEAGVQYFSKGLEPEVHKEVFDWNMQWTKEFYEMTRPFSEEKKIVESFFSQNKMDEDGVPLKLNEFLPHNFRNKDKHPEISLGTRSINTLKKFRNFEKYYKIHAEAEETQYPYKNPAPVVCPPRNGMTVDKFLKSIGRDCHQYTSKFKNWNEFITSTGYKLKEKEIPTRSRKYILDCLEKYRQGKEPETLFFTSKTRRNSKLEWRTKLYTQKELREKYELD